MTTERPMFPPVADSTDAFSVKPAIGLPESQTRSSESRKPAGGLSRRHVFAGLALLPAALPAAAVALDDPIFAIIEAKREADVAHSAACDVLNEAEKRFGFGSEEAEAAWVAQGVTCHAAHEACELMTSTPPTTLAGVLAVLRFANELQEKGIWIEDMDLEQQLIATTAIAIEAIIRKGAVA